MSSEIEKKDNQQVFELNKPNNQQPASNTPAYSGMMYPNVQPYPGNPSFPNNMYPTNNMHPTNNTYPNQLPQIHIPNDVTRDTCSSIGCSIFNLIFCFFWFGIPALIFSCKAQDNVATGRLVEAQSDAKIAKILNTVGIVVGSLIIVIIIIAVAVVVSTASTPFSSYYYYG